MLIGGPATLPWTFLGSFLLNLWTAYSDGHGSDEPWWIAAVVIASASMLQAAIGGTTLRHAVEEAEVAAQIHQGGLLVVELEFDALAAAELTKVDIAAALEKARAKRAERAELKADWVVEELRKIGFANMAWCCRGSR